LSEASAEGMTGGERSKLHEVLKAKDTLTLHLKHTWRRGELHSSGADRSCAVAL